MTSLLRAVRLFLTGLGAALDLAFKTIAATFRLSRSALLLMALLISFLLNIAAFTTGVIATTVSSAVEAVTGAKSVWTRATTAESEVAALSDDLASATQATKTAKAAETKAATKVSQLEGTAAGKGLALAEAQKAEAAAAARAAAFEAETLSLRAARRVTVDGVEMPAEKAVTLVTRRMQTRAAKWAATDLAATAGQALPWIGIGVVVAATTYDLKNTCDTMTDAHALELAFQKDATDTAEVDSVCGLKVPTAEEIWTEIAASPGQVWDATKSVLSGLPDVMPQITWPSPPDMSWLELWN